MNMLTKVLVVVNLVLAIAVAAFTFTLWAKQVSWVRDLEKVTNEYNALKEVKARLDTQLALREKELFDQTAEAERRLAVLEKERNELKSANATLQDATGKLGVNYQSLDASLKKLIVEKDESNKKIAELAKERDGLRTLADLSKQVEAKAKAAAVTVASELQAANDQVTSLIAERRILAQRLDALQSLMERYVDTFGDIGGGGSESTVSVSAVITTIDRDVNLLVINAGESKGVRKGMVFTFSREDKYLGKGVVRNVLPTLAVLAISDMTPDPTAIEIGDAARTL